MFIALFRPKNLSQKLLRAIFSIYMVVTFVVTSVQFVTEYLKTQDSIIKELNQLEQTVRVPISTSLWQYNQNQLEALTTGLIELPIIEGVDVFDSQGESVVSKRSYASSSTPLSIFDTKSDLNWELNGQEIPLGSLTLYSSSEVVLDRVVFGFALIAITALIKISILFWLFIWAFDRFLAIPLKELMSQVDDIQLGQNINKRFNLSVIEENELYQLQEHMNMMLSAIERDRERLLEDEKAKRNWLEDAVETRTEELLKANEKLKNLAAKDSLTDALNRGSFFESAQHMLVLSQRQKNISSFVMMDLDHFKMINDTYGHFVGDKVLIHFSHTVKTLLRKSDLLGRLGGEEFAIFLPDTGLDGAFQLANKLRKVIADSVLEIEGKAVSYTVSLGVVSTEPKDTSIDELFKRADLKLYEAKAKGRDRVER